MYEPELIDLIRFQAGSPAISSPSVQSLSSSTSASPLINLSPSFRWLLPPDYSRSSVISSTSSSSSSSNNTSFSTNTSPLIPAYPSTPSPQLSDIETIADSLFQDIKEDMCNNIEFHNFLQEWYEENKENIPPHQINLPCTQEEKKP